MFPYLFLLCTCLKFQSADSINSTLLYADWLAEKSAAVADKGYVKTPSLSDISAVVISHNDSASDKSVEKASTKPKTENATTHIEESGLDTGATLPTFTPTSSDTDDYPEAKPPSLCLNTTQHKDKLKPHELSSAILNMTSSLLKKVFSQEWKDSDVPVLLKEISEANARVAKELENIDGDPLDSMKMCDPMEHLNSKILYSIRDLAFMLGDKSEWYQLWKKFDYYNTITRIDYEGFEDIEGAQELAEYVKSIMKDMVKAITRNVDGSCRKKEGSLRHNSTFPSTSVQSFLLETEENDNSSYCYEATLIALRNLFSNKSLSSAFCAFTTSPQQLLRQLHDKLAITDARAYATVQFCLMVLHLFRVGDLNAESKLMQKGYERTLIEQDHVLKELIDGSSKWFSKCIPEPWRHRENRSFIRFTEVLQGYIVNEVDLNSKQSCRGGCENYKATKEFGCYQKTFCNTRNKCDTGKLYDCTFVEADSTVCLSSSKNRRYDWVKYKSGRLLGHDQQCDEGRTSANSWWRVTSHCTYCVCLCDKPGPSSDRYISLKPVVSNIHLGNIVTGVKFIKQGRVVHIQIQEGKALPRGEVNESTIAWQEVQPIVVDSLNDTTTNNIDYATLSWHQRAIDLDHLEAPKDHVVTGLRFRRLVGHLNLEIQVTPIDSATAVMDPTSSIWLGNNNTLNSEIPRKEVLLSNADGNLLSPGEFLQESGHNEYVQFQASSLEKDLGQTTVPFLDALMVAPKPPLWLSGIALIHRGSPGNGGFISLKVATYDLESSVAIP